MTDDLCQQLGWIIKKLESSIQASKKGWCQLDAGTEVRPMVDILKQIQSLEDVKK